VRPAQSARLRLPFKGTEFQQGQALIYGLFVLASALAALFFLFNTGQLSREKTKLVNTADAVAYSAGVMHARTLNFQAYTNRAMVANTVTIAQLVSLASWVQYVDTAATYGFMLGNRFKYPAFYPSYQLMQLQGSDLKSTLIDRDILKNLAETSDDIIRRVLMRAQQVAYEGLLPARQAVMDDVARANYLNDGTVTVEPLPLTVNAFAGFVSHYSGDDRTRFAEVAETSAKRDGFQRRRSWSWIGTYANCMSATLFEGRRDWINRRGGTELIGFDEWKAMDTISERQWVPMYKGDWLCQHPAEMPAGWGLQSAADNPQPDLDPRHYDSSLPVNPIASGLALTISSSSWGYSGLPNFYDLSADALGQDDPRLKFAIRVRRAKDQTVTSEGRSAIPATDRLNAYHATPAGGSDLVAVSASEVFFERPDLENLNCSDGSPMGRDNCYGRTVGGRSREIGSLFNPYWQVRLIQSAEGVAQAQAMQGAQLP
jgi:hypothetical protein